MSVNGRKSEEVNAQKEKFAEELVALKEKLAATEEERDSYKNRLENLKKSYNEKVIDTLESFDGKNILNGYLDHAYGVNIRSKKKMDEYKPNLNNKSLKDPPLYMDHILFHFMKQDVSKLAAMWNYALKDNPKNLEESYNRSAQIANSLTNSKRSLAWFINLKTPITYKESQSAVKNQQVIAKTLRIKPQVDARRIHLFYEEFFKCHEDLYKKELTTLLTTFLLEFLHGIESRVLYVKGDYDAFKKVLYQFGDSTEKSPLFLLDFALYFSHEQNKASFKMTEQSLKDLNSEGISDEVLKSLKRIENLVFKGEEQFLEILKTKIGDEQFVEYKSLILKYSRNNGDYLNGATHVLCSDFTAETPDFDRLFNYVTGKLNKKELKALTDSYEMDKVYVFDNPLIYSTLKNYFLSLWNESEYEIFLKNLDKTHKEEDCQYTNPNNRTFADLDRIEGGFFQNVDTLDFIDLLQLCRDKMGSGDLIDLGFFEKQYTKSGGFEKTGFTPEWAKNIIGKIICEFPIPNNKSEAWKKLDAMSSNFQLRKMNRFI